MRGWRVSDNRYFMKYDDVAWRAGDPRSIKIRNRNLLFFGRGKIVLDIFVKYPHGEHTWWAALGKVCRVERSFFDGHDILRYAGREVRVPRDYRRYLEILYGDWRTPVREFNAATDDGSILRPVEDAARG